MIFLILIQAIKQIYKNSNKNHNYLAVGSSNINTIYGNFVASAMKEVVQENNQRQWLKWQSARGSLQDCNRKLFIKINVEWFSYD